MEDKPFEDIVLTNKEQGKGHTSQLSMKVLYVLLIAVQVFFIVLFICITAFFVWP